jgi:hypothetical protein
MYDLPVGGIQSNLHVNDRPRDHMRERQEMTTVHILNHDIELLERQRFCSQHGINGIGPAISNLPIILYSNNDRALAPQWITFPYDKIPRIGLPCCFSLCLVIRSDSQNSLDIGRYESDGLLVSQPCVLTSPQSLLRQAVNLRIALHC